MTSSLARRSATLIALVLLTALVAINLWVLRHHYFDPAFANPDWRAVIRTIDDHSLPGDAILLTGDGGEKLFDYYYQGSLPVYDIFNTPAPPPAEARQLLADIAGNSQRLWYTAYGVEIDTTLAQWLAENTFPAWHTWLGRKQLALYDTRRPTERTVSLDTTLVDPAGLGPTLTSLDLPDYPVTAGDLLPLSLVWRTDSPLPVNYQISLRLINEWSDTFVQSDWPPLSAHGGTSAWTPQQTITDQRSLWIPGDTPPGRFQLQLVVYDPASGEALGQPVIIDDIIVAPAERVVPLAALSIPNILENQPGDHPNHKVIPVGYALPPAIQPGQEMWLWLYWQAQRTPDENTRLRISLTGQAQSFTTDFDLADSVGPLDSWQPGQVRRAIYHLPTSPRLTGESASVNVSLVSGQAVQQPTNLARLALASRPRQYEVPSLSQPLNAVFGSSAIGKLIGFDSPAAARPGAGLPVTLYWQAVSETEVNYTVFIHLLTAAGQVVVQQDLQPQAGAAPTTTWLPGEILEDRHTLALPPDLESGDYRLIVGLYDASTGQRLPVSSGRDFVELGEVSIQ